MKTLKNKVLNGIYTNFKKRNAKNINVKKKNKLNSILKYIPVLNAIRATFLFKDEEDGFFLGYFNLVNLLMTSLALCLSDWNYFKISSTISISIFGCFFLASYYQLLKKIAYLESENEDHINLSVEDVNLLMNNINNKIMNIFIVENNCKIEYADLKRIDELLLYEESILERIEMMEGLEEMDELEFELME